MKKSNRGIAMVVIIFFSFAIAIILFTMIRSNTNLSFQNKNTIKALQANYLAHSAMQHAKLHLRLLPREVYQYFQANPTSTNALNKIDSTQYPPIDLGSWKKEKIDYDLFKTGASDDRETPYGGSYRVTSIECLTIDNDAKLVQDNYRVKVESVVLLNNDKFEDSITEEFAVSRHIGGR
ncbi:MAG: hypothetical protein PHF29_02000 [Candidatus Riflebacteria bacterium]|nr:hypothetical protein [Candidatus Riflebacteria bacterium]